MKTNKSYAKRIKVTRNGKVIARKPGQNHFNARENRNTQLDKKRTQTLNLTNRAKRQFLANI
jgi:ribosomal protein L35